MSECTEKHQISASCHVTTELPDDILQTNLLESLRVLPKTSQDQSANLQALIRHHR
ncbi:hypothetical protein BCEP4_690016 [Burkholderia cepacia]|nr:hypothetical protein BCEP4_690016 [Burkholderia cepacia]